MAIFNPEIPDIKLRADPNWTGVSHPIQDIPVVSDKSKALGIETAATGIEGATKLAESTQEDIIKEKTRAGVETLRDVSTAAYESIRNSMVTGKTPDPNAMRTAGFTGTLMGASEDVPAGLEAGLDRAGEIGTALAQNTGNKNNKTLYDGALNSLAKELRSQYPGHKDFIDEQISKISGKNPANAYMDNLLQDINRLAGNKDTIEQKTIQKAFDNYGDHDVQQALRAYHAKLPDSFKNLEETVYRAEASKLKHQQIINSHQENEAGDKDDKSLAQFQAQQTASTIAFRNFNPVIAVPGLTSPAMQQKLLDEHRAGLPSSISQENWIQMAQNAHRARDVADAEMKTQFNRLGLSGRLKDPAGEKSIRDNELLYFDNQIAAIEKQDVGTIFELQRRAKGLQDQTNYQVATNPDFGDYLRKRAAIREKAGDSWVNFLDSEGLKKNYLGPMTSWMNDVTQRIGVSDDVRNDGVSKSMTADILQAKKIARDKTNQVDPRVYSDLVHNVELITKAEQMKNPEVAKEAVKYAFDPVKNANFYKQFGRDFTDDTGVFHEGKFAYYDVMSGKKIVDSVWKLGDRGSWDTMKNWQETQFKKLFGEEVNNLNSIQGDNSIPMNMRWDDKTHHMVLKFDTPPKTDVERNYQKWATDSVGKLNRGIDNLHHMHSKEGGNTDEYVFNMLMGLGYSPNDRLHGDNMPQRVIEAIANTHKKPESPESEALRKTR